MTFLKILFKGLGAISLCFVSSCFNVNKSLEYFDFFSDCFQKSDSFQFRNIDRKSCFFETKDYSNYIDNVLAKNYVYVKKDNTIQPISYSKNNNDTYLFDDYGFQYKSKYSEYCLNSFNVCCKNNSFVFVDGYSATIYDLNTQILTLENVFHEDEIYVANLSFCGVADYNNCFYFYALNTINEIPVVSLAWYDCYFNFINNKNLYFENNVRSLFDQEYISLNHFFEPILIKNGKLCVLINNCYIVLDETTNTASIDSFLSEVETGDKIFFDNDKLHIGDCIFDLTLDKKYYPNVGHINKSIICVDTKDIYITYQVESINRFSPKDKGKYDLLSNFYLFKFVGSSLEYFTLDSCSYSLGIEKRDEYFEIYISSFIHEDIRSKESKLLYNNELYSFVF